MSAPGFIPDTWQNAYYLGITCDVALPYHQDAYGPPRPGYGPYQCIGPIPAPLGGEVVRVYSDLVSDAYRIAVTYEWADPPTNMAVTTHDWLHETVDVLTDSDYGSLETHMDIFFNAIAPLMNNQAKVTGYRWTKLLADGTGNDGPSFRFTEKSIAGTNAAMLPPQVSCSVTEITSTRRRWGRFYLPFIGTLAAGTGRFTDQTCDSISAAAAALSAGVEGVFHGIVYGAKSPPTLDVISNRVDNVPDVIRSRRWSAPTHRSTTVVS